MTATTPRPFDAKLAAQMLDTLAAHRRELDIGKSIAALRALQSWLSCLRTGTVAADAKEAAICAEQAAMWLDRLRCAHAAVRADLGREAQP